MWPFSKKASTPAPAATSTVVTAPAKTNWDRVGSILATIAKLAGQSALWASQHPQVVQTVATLAGHPEVAAVAAKAAPIAQAVGSAIEQDLASKKS